MFHCLCLCLVLLLLKEADPFQICLLVFFGSNFILIGSTRSYTALSFPRGPSEKYKMCLVESYI